MKLLQEFLTINENNSDTTRGNIDGNIVRLVVSEIDAERGVYVGKQTYRATRTSPAEYGDDQDAYLKINSLMFDVKNQTNEYTLIFNLDSEDFLDKPKEFNMAIMNTTPEIYDDYASGDAQIKTELYSYLRNLVIKYTNTFDCLPYVYDKAYIKELEYDDDDKYYD